MSLRRCLLALLGGWMLLHPDSKASDATRATSQAPRLPGTPMHTPKRTFALLVGVSGYPELDASKQLRGPANDVRLLREVFVARGVPPGQVAVLADGVDGSLGDPDRRAVLRALNDMTAQRRPDDLVVLYFAGHGSQQPEKTSGSEVDGLDEVFLPRDVGRWDAPLRTIRNAITDDEIAAYVGRLRAGGSTVWLIFDSCHSGSMAHFAGVEEVHERSVSMADLGVPRAEIGFDSRRAARKDRIFEISTPRKGQNNGRYVGFFAARAGEQAPELPLPAGSPRRRTMGLLTYHLAEALSATDSRTYGQAASKIRARYRAERRSGPTPTFEGDLTTPLFGLARRTYD